MPGLRIVSAVVGTVSVGVVGFLAYELFDVRRDNSPVPMSVVATLFAATLPVHLHYSRLGLFNIMDAVTFALAAAFLLRALRLNERVSFAAAGVMLGMTHYFYEVAKVMALPLLVIWLVFYGERILQGRWRGLLLTGVVAAFIIVLPWTVDRYTEVDSLARLRVSSVLLNPEISLQEKVVHTAFMFKTSLTTITSHGDLEVNYFVSQQGFVPV